MATGDPTQQPTAPDIQTPPPSAPDLSALTGPAPAAPSVLDATVGGTSYNSAMATSAAAAKKATDIANQPVVNPTVPHAKLLAMVQGLSLGLGSFGKAIATHGQEGGVEEVQQVRQQQQAQKIQAQEAAQAQKNAQIQQQLTVADTNQKLANSILLMHAVPIDMALKDVELSKGQQELAGGAQELATGKLKYQSDTNDFILKYGYSPEVNTPDGVKGAAAANLPGANKFQSNYIDFAAGVLPDGEKNPAVVAARAALSKAGNDNDATLAATAGLRQAVALHEQTVEMKTKEETEAAAARPKDLASATSQWVQAKQTADADPSPDNIKKRDDAAQQRAALYNDHMAEVREQAKIQAGAGGKGIEAMLNTGVNPLDGTRLDVSNAPDEMLVDTRTGKPIPLKMLPTMKPTMQESNRADFAASALHTLGVLDTLRAQGKLPNGPLQGRTTADLAKLGLVGQDAQTAIDLISLGQSAATGAHVGGRFNVPIMDKMAGLLSLNMNDAQFTGGEDALRDVLNQYTQTGGRTTVAQWNQLSPADQQKLMSDRASGGGVTTSSGKDVSLKAAMALPANQGKTEDQVRADIAAHGHRVTQ